jgi:predicted nucleotidyltransferase
MQENNALLAEVLSQRLKTIDKRAQLYVAKASELVVFGSMSVGLERPDSDIDIFCVGDCDYKLKSDLLDLVIVSSERVRQDLWLQSELASHVAKYGVWITGVSSWKREILLGENAIVAKRRRILAFMRALHGSWFKLNERFRVKYSVKLRRETQRLLLLERGIAVPPTSVLDHFWASLSISRNEVRERLRSFALNVSGEFVDDLLSRVSAAMEWYAAPGKAFRILDSTAHDFTVGG